MTDAPITSVQNPITTTSSIIGIKYDSGILLASDRSISQGSCFKFSNVSHFHQLSPRIIIGCSGEYADFQELADALDAVVSEFRCRHFGEELSPREVANYVKRLMYQRRSKMNPFMLRCVLAGVAGDGSLFLCETDTHGTQWEDSAVTTGIAAYIKGRQLELAVNGTKAAAAAALKEVLLGLAARHSVMTGKIEIIDVSKDGILFSEADIDPNWEIIDAVPYDE